MPASGRSTSTSLPPALADALLAPTLAPGELLIFDYRVEHRGLGNRTDASRPVAYITYAPDGVEHDLFNFPVGVSLLAGQQLEPVDAFYAGAT